jgi:hypothetical protein
MFEPVGRFTLTGTEKTTQAELHEQVRLLLLHNAASSYRDRGIHGREAKGYRKAIMDVLKLIKDMKTE